MTMKEKDRMNWKGLFGPIAAILLVTGVVTLALLVPGYDPIRQTVSEIGEAGSPMQRAFAVLLSSVAACLLAFASAVRDASRAAGHSSLAAWFVGAMAISVAGVGLFSFPHPLHNVFGLSELVGYQAPLVLALTWRGDRSALVRVSWLMAVLVWVAIVLNLATIDRQGALFAFERPFYGLVQRALFLAWFGWCAITGVMLSPMGRR
jgi:hypothetical membrane protein